MEAAFETAALPASPGSIETEVAQDRFVSRNDAHYLMLLARRLVRETDHAWSAEEEKTLAAKAVEALLLRDRILDEGLPSSDRTVSHLKEIPLFAAEADLVTEARQVAGQISDPDVE